jgi:hypothetical protein
LTLCYDLFSCISKRRIDDLNFLSPRTTYDFRCSCSVEEPCSPPVNMKPISQRKKNRLSYRDKFVQVDITTVFSYEDDQIPLSETTVDPSSLSYEVELEVTPEAALYDARILWLKLGCVQVCLII